jgi:hypothetical protein
MQGLYSTTEESVTAAEGAPAPRRSRVYEDHTLLRICERLTQMLRQQDRTGQRLS